MALLNKIIASYLKSDLHRNEGHSADVLNAIFAVTCTNNVFGRHSSGRILFCQGGFKFPTEDALVSIDNHVSCFDFFDEVAPDDPVLLAYDRETAEIMGRFLENRHIDVCKEKPTLRDGDILYVVDEPEPGSTVFLHRISVRTF